MGGGGEERGQRKDAAVGDDLCRIPGAALGDDVGHGATGVCGAPAREPARRHEEDEDAGDPVGAADGARDAHDGRGDGPAEVEQARPARGNGDGRGDDEAEEGAGGERGGHAVEDDAGVTECDLIAAGWAGAAVGRPENHAVPRFPGRARRAATS